MTGPLFLVGFMGSGKSAVGRRVAGELDLPFRDSDRLVAADDGRPVDRIFREEGEPFFRAAEAAAIEGLASAGPAVVATGGGSFMPHRSRRRMIGSGITVWLDVPFDIILRRLQGDRSRPLWDPEDPAGMRKLYEVRKPAYALARHRVEGSDLVEAAAAVLRLIR